MSDIATRLIAVPVEFSDACAFVDQHHRHHVRPQGHKFSIGASTGGAVVGVVIVGRPVSRMMQDGWTLEVTRLATDGTKNACSFLYAAAWRAAHAMGYRKLTTCILDTEPGTTLRAAGWRLVGKAGGGSWSVPSRPRVDKHPTQGKLRFEITEKPTPTPSPVRECGTCASVKDKCFPPADRACEKWLALAKQFHATYERLAPEYGYETRPDTREFDPTSANGKLMIAVCQAIIQQNTTEQARAGSASPGSAGSGSNSGGQ